MLGFPTRIASIFKGERSNVISRGEASLDGGTRTNGWRGVQGIHGISLNFSVNARGIAILGKFPKAHILEHARQTKLSPLDRIDSKRERANRDSNLFSHRFSNYR